MDTRLTRVIISQFIVAKTLYKNPKKALRFITDNPQYFPYATKEWLETIKKELNVSDDDIENEGKVVFEDYYAELNADQQMYKQAEEIHKNRENTNKNRDFGHGIKSRFESDVPTNVYKSVNQTQTE